MLVVDAGVAQPRGFNKGAIMFAMKNLNEAYKRSDLPIIVEIDGKIEQFDELYSEEETGFPSLGAFYGCNEVTKANDKVRGFQPTSPLFAVSAWRKEPNGDIFGMQAIFKNGTWTTNDNGDPMLSVRDRLI